MQWDGACVANTDVATIKGIVCLVKNLITPLPGIIILLAFFMVLWSGVRMIMAGADPKAYSAAWNTFNYSIIGLILLSGAWLILIIIQNLTGAQVTQFGI